MTASQNSANTSSFLIPFLCLAPTLTLAIGQDHNSDAVEGLARQVPTPDHRMQYNANIASV